jgi:hypothetical protein
MWKKTMTESFANAIDYVPGSSVGSFDPVACKRFEKWLQTGYPNIVFDSDYIQHIQSTNGGIPVQNLFMTSRGHERLIERVMHFKDLPAEHPLDADGVEVAHTLVGMSEAFDDQLIPFASLFAGDLLCFDFRNLDAGNKPPVVVWLHEESDIDNPATDYVAPSFREFVKMLYVSKYVSEEE